jgi:hypothetical protein
MHFLINLPAGPKIRRQPQWANMKNVLSPADRGKARD